MGEASTRNTGFSRTALEHLDALYVSKLEREEVRDAIERPPHTKNQDFIQELKPG